jgi:NADPH:quinone reductase-like Zn-dependent oxidoreductase
MLSELGAQPLDYRDPALGDRVRELAPGGLDAVFDNIGTDSFTRSFHQLAPGGTLVGYGLAGQRDDTDNMILTFAKIMSRFALWSALPNRGRSATFYNFWAGKTIARSRFHNRLATDLGRVLELVQQGALTAPVAERLPLRDAGQALALAESGSTRGKVILVPHA